MTVNFNLIREMVMGDMFIKITANIPDNGKTI